MVLAPGESRDVPVGFAPSQRVVSALRASLAATAVDAKAAPGAQTNGGSLVVLDDAD